MATIYVSVGSNVDPEHYIRKGLDRLRRLYGQLMLSPVYQTQAVGFDGDDFLNLVLAFDTGDPVEDLAATLDDIENQCGRIRGEARFGPRTLDLDLLLYDDAVIDLPGLKLPRDEILKYAFVLKPLADLAPDVPHPVIGRRFADLWRDYDGPDADMRPVQIDLLE